MTKNQEMKEALTLVEIRHQRLQESIQSAVNLCTRRVALNARIEKANKAIRADDAALDEAERALLRVVRGQRAPGLDFGKVTGVPQS